MAAVPEDTGIPSIAPQVGVPDNYQRVQADPEAFGAGIGRGLEQIGNAVGRVEQGGAEILDFYDHVASDQAKNHYNAERTRILYGDPAKTVPGPDGKPVPDTGYFGLTGKAAMFAQPQVMADLDKFAKEASADLRPNGQRLFGDYISSTLPDTEATVGRHASQQQNVWAKSVNEADATTNLNELAAAPNDPAVRARTLQGVLGAYVKQSQLDGTDPRLATLRAQQDVALTRVQSTVVSDPTKALKILADNKAILAALPQYDGLYNQTLARVRGVLKHSAADAALASSMPRNLPHANNLSDAILGQESGGGADTRTSPTGAVGAFQIEPQTFQRYAKPGEVITNPADNARVGNRIVADLEKKYPNDPARAAVAYYSGESNVSPLGSPTPWVRDISRDRNGNPTKPVSAYVSDILARLGGGGTSAAPQTAADYYRENFAAVEDQARQNYLAQNPGDIEGADGAASLADTKMRAVLMQDEMRVKADYHALDAAATKPGANGQPPITIDQLLQTNPELREGWENLQLTNPYAAQNFENHLLKANAMPASTTYGHDFYDLYGKVIGGQIKTAAGLLPFIDATKGDGSPLTKEGYAELGQVLARNGTPQGKADNVMLQNFFKAAHQQINPLENPSLGVFYQKGNDQFNHYMTKAMGDIRAQQAAGTPLADILKEGSPVYNSRFSGHFVPTPAELLDARFKGVTYDPRLKGARDRDKALKGAKTADDLQAALAAGHISKHDRDEEAIRRGWARRPNPVTPAHAP